MSQKVFGHPPGIPVGTAFPDRKTLRDAKVHLPLQAGIHGTRREGADSIVVSGGYVDDKDNGDVIVYTGAGGNDRDSKRQIQDQSTEHTYNAGLITSELHGHPVRVIRGRHRGSPFAPKSGYRYDGLFKVSSHWIETGRDGFKIVRFRLEKLDDALY